MSDKLLRAFIEASGFDIETIITEGPSIRRVDSLGSYDDFKTIIDYKVTKKKVNPLFVDWEPVIAIEEGETINYIDGKDYTMINGVMVLINEKD